MKVVIASFLLSAVLASVSAQDRRILVFSKTFGFRHDSIPAGLAAIRDIARQNGFAVDATEDSARFDDAALAAYDAVVFLSTTGDVLSEAEQAALERFIRGGRGFVGIHSAADTEYGWAWYGRLVGARFRSHPEVQGGEVRIADRVHPSTRGLPDPWARTDEWYNFSTNPRGAVHVLATLDETTYAGGDMGADHPVSWCQLFDGGRSWYTALGHTIESYAEPLFREHLLGGIQFAAGYPDCEGRSPRALPPR